MLDGATRVASHVLALILCLVLAACGGEDRPKNIVVDGGLGGSGAFGGAGGTAATDGGPDPGAPLVQITSPPEVTDPNSEGVIVANNVDVVCRVTASNEPEAGEVDPASVKLELRDADDDVVAEAPGTPTAIEGEYSTNFVLSPISNGPFTLHCSATDTSPAKAEGSDSLTALVDHGPEIKVTSPVADGAYPLAGAVPFSFEVIPSPLDDTDQNAAVSSVKLSVNGVDIPVTPDASNPNLYQTSVNFNDTSLFPQAPTGSISVEIVARNSRTPDPGQRLHSYHFNLDGTGPVITITSHKDQEIIGGKVPLVFTVTDAISAVDANTVSVKLNQTSYPNGTGQWSVVGNEYTFTFDSANVSGSESQMTVNISAKDAAGNESPGASLLLYLDNQAPIVDLDPGNVRTTRKQGPTGLQCSESFDPLGIATDDLATIQNFAMFRALVWDRTNKTDGQLVFYFSAINQDKVYLYLQPDSNVPLLVNNDANADCDVVNAAPGGVELPKLQLKSVKPTGNAWFHPNDTNAHPAAPGCDTGNDTQPPKKLCDQEASDLTVVIKHDMTGDEPAVYGIGALMGLECTGSGWEISSQLANATNKQGWFCLAVSAEDNVKNAAVSRPLRVCYDNPNVPGAPACAISSTTPPSCTDGCTPPPKFDGHILDPH